MKESLIERMKGVASFCWNAILPETCMVCRFEYVPPGSPFCSSCSSSFLQTKIRTRWMGGAQRGSPQDVEEFERPIYHYEALRYLLLKGGAAPLEDELSRALIREIKFHENRLALRLLQTKLNRVLESLPLCLRPAAVVCAPSSKKLAPWLANGVGAFYNIPVYHLFTKEVGQESKTKNRLERFRLIEDSIALAPAPFEELRRHTKRGEIIWLSDDLTASGATLNRCAALIKEAFNEKSDQGPPLIDVFTLFYQAPSAAS